MSRSTLQLTDALVDYLQEVGVPPTCPRPCAPRRRPARCGHADLPGARPADDLARHLWRAPCHRGGPATARLTARGRTRRPAGRDINHETTGRRYREQAVSRTASTSDFGRRSTPWMPCWSWRGGDLTSASSMPTRVATTRTTSACCSCPPRWSALHRQRLVGAARPCRPATQHRGHPRAQRQGPRRCSGRQRAGSHRRRPCWCAGGETTGPLALGLAPHARRGSTPRRRPPACPGGCGV